MRTAWMAALGMIGALAWGESQYTVVYQSFRLKAPAGEAFHPKVDGAVVTGVIEDVPVELMPGLKLSAELNGFLKWHPDWAPGNEFAEQVTDAKIAADAGKRYQIVSEGEPIEYFELEKDNLYRLKHSESAPVSRIELTIQPGSDDQSVKVAMKGTDSVLAGRVPLEGVMPEVGMPKFSKSEWDTLTEAKLGRWIFVLKRELPELESNETVRTATEVDTLFKIVLKNTVPADSMGKSANGTGAHGGIGGGGFGGGSFGGGSFGGGMSKGGFGGMPISAEENNAVYSIHLLRVQSNVPTGTPSRQVSIEAAFCKVNVATAETALRSLPEADSIVTHKGQFKAYRVPVDPEKTAEYKQSILDSFSRHKDTETLSAPRVTTLLADNARGYASKVVTSSSIRESDSFKPLLKMDPEIVEFMGNRGALIADVASATADGVEKLFPTGILLGLRIHPTNSMDTFRVEMLAYHRQQVVLKPLPAYNTASLRADYEYSKGDIYIFTTPMGEKSLLAIVLTIEEVAHTEIPIYSGTPTEFRLRDVDGDGNTEPVPFVPRGVYAPPPPTRAE
ncbi:MAG: hypothetical protein AMXMBFR84_11330 [Candidatus Hydrogenedentota bacterium]